MNVDNAIPFATASATASATADGSTPGSSDSGDSASIAASINRPVSDTDNDNGTPLTSPKSAFGHVARGKAAAAGAGDETGPTLSISLDEPCGSDTVWQAYRGTMRSGDIASRVVAKLRHFYRSAGLVREDDELARDALMNED